jgi:chorismate mutase
MACRGVRGAITVPANTEQAILAATRELLEAIIEANVMRPADVASVIFTATGDLDAAYPARAARQLGWTETALLCMQEMDVAGSLPRCVRVLIHWNTDVPQSGIQHVYLREAAALRKDLARPPHSSKA